MIYEFDNITLLNTITRLLSDGLKPTITSVSKPYEGVGSAKFIVVDIVNLMPMLTRDVKLLKNYKSGEELAYYYHETKKFYNTMYLSSYSNDNTINNITEFLMDSKKLQSVYSTYILYTDIVEEIQLKWFSLYKINPNTVPVMIIPYSRSLHRINKEIINVIGKDKNNMYKVRKNILKDTMKQIILPMEVSNKCKTIIYSGNPEEIDLPDKWIESTKWINNLKSYKEERLNVIKKLYAEYMFTGHKTIDEIDKETNYYIGNPFISQNEYELEDISSMDILVPKNTLITL